METGSVSGRRTCCRRGHHGEDMADAPGGIG